VSEFPECADATAECSITQLVPPVDHDGSEPKSSEYGCTFREYLMDAGTFIWRKTKIGPCATQIVRAKLNPVDGTSKGGSGPKPKRTIGVWGPALVHLEPGYN
jgi:hypothetical protein